METPTETRVRVAGIRKGDCTAQVTTYHDNAFLAEQWIAQHMEEENNAHVYQLAPVIDGQVTNALYIVNGQTVTETEWLTAINNKKEVTQ
jgi:phage terminase large subunit